MDAGGLWVGDFACMMSQSTGEVSDVNSHLGYRWLWLYYSYDDRIRRDLGSFAHNHVQLPHTYNLDPAQVRAGLST